MKDFTVVRRIVEKLIEDNYTGPLTLVFENTLLSAVDEEHIKIVDEGDILQQSLSWAKSNGLALGVGFAKTCLAIRKAEHQADWNLCVFCVLFCKKTA